MNSTLRRLVVAFAALLVLVLPAVGPAAAAPAAAPAVAPAAAPALAPGWNWWGTACTVIATPVLGTAAGSIGCAAAVIVAPEAKKAISEALQSTIVKPMADGMGEFTAQILKVGLTWWLTTPSVQVRDSGVLASQTGKDSSGATVTYSLQGLMLGLGELIAIMLLMFQGIKTMIQRKGQPLVEAVQGLLINALVVSIGIVVIDTLLVASDELTNSIINVAFHGNEKLSERMVAMLLPQAFNPMALLVMALIVLLIGVIQFGLLFLRQAAIPIQALLLPIAGAGQIGGDRTRQWLPRLYTSILTVICYKPLAALIISAGFMELANGNNVIDWIRGIATLILSVIALKSLMGLFAPLGMQMAGATSGGFAGALQAAGALADMAGRFGGGKGGGGDSDSGGGGGGETSAVQQAQQMSQQTGGGGQGVSHPAVMAAQMGVKAVEGTRQAAGNAVSGADNPIPQQPGSNGQGGNGQNPSATGGQAPDGQTPGGNSPAASGGNSVSSAAGNVSVSLRAAETASRAVQGAGNTVSEGSKEQ